MSRFSNISDGETKRCAICQKHFGKASYFRGRYVCDDCLSTIRQRF